MWSSPCGSVKPVVLVGLLLVALLLLPNSQAGLTQPDLLGNDDPVPLHDEGTDPEDEDAAGRGGPAHQQGERPAPKPRPLPTDDMGMDGGAEPMGPPADVPSFEGLFTPDGGDEGDKVPASGIPVPPGMVNVWEFVDLAWPGPGTGPGCAACDSDPMGPRREATNQGATTVDAPEAWPATAAGLTVFALLGLAFWRFVLPALAAFKAIHLGYRIERQGLFDHPLRRKMIDHLNENPGATAADLAKVAGITYARATYHIAMLTREQAIRMQRVDHKKRYFPFAAPKQDLETLRLKDLAREDTLSGRMLDFLRRAPGLTVSRLSRALGISPGHAHYHLSRLIQNGLLESKRSGREVRYYLTDMSRVVAPPRGEAVRA